MGYLELEANSINNDYENESQVLNFFAWLDSFKISHPL